MWAKPRSAGGNPRGAPWAVLNKTAFAVAVTILFIGRQMFGAPSTVRRKQDIVAAQRESIPTVGADHQCCLASAVRACVKWTMFSK